MDDGESVEDVGGRPGEATGELASSLPGPQATAAGLAGTDAAYRAGPAGRRPPRERYRRAVRSGLTHAGIGTWGAPLVVLALCLLAWALPFAAPPPAGAAVWLDVPIVTHPHPAASVAPLVSIDALGATLDGRRVAPEADVSSGGGPTPDPLARDLETIRRNWGLVHPGVPYAGRIALRVAPGTPWARIRPVLLRAARAGHARVAFLVQAPPSESPAFDWARFGAAPRPRHPPSPARCAW